MSNGLEVRDNSKAVMRTTQGHLLVDPEISPAHFKIVDVIATGITSIAGETVSETVLTIPHKLTYAPYTDCYFFPGSDLPSNPDAFFQTNGSYYHNFFSYIGLGGAGVGDSLRIKVDDVALRVIHEYFNFSGGTSAPFPVKMKYTIFSNPGYAQF